MAETLSAPHPRVGWVPLFYAFIVSLCFYFTELCVIIYSYVCSVFFTLPAHKPVTFKYFCLFVL